MFPEPPSPKRNVIKHFHETKIKFKKKVLKSKTKTYVDSTCRKIVDITGRIKVDITGRKKWILLV